MKELQHHIKKKILIISFSTLASDPRVLRQFNSLKDLHEVYTCGLDSDFGSEGHMQISKPTFIIKPVLAVMRLLKLNSLSETVATKFMKTNTISGFPEKFDLVIANDINSVPAAFNKFKSASYMIDLHEYSTEEIDEGSFRNFIQKDYLEYLCRKYLPEASSVTSVNETISGKIQAEFKVPVYTITNAPYYSDLKPSEVDKDSIRIIHHGAAISSRKIEIMIEAAKFFDKRFTLDLMLIPNEESYLNYLKKYAEGMSNVRFIPPVKHEEIVKFCNDYDIGIFILPPENANYEYALPNKFFEFIQSRLAVITGPSPEMKRLINKFKIGIAAGSYEPLEAAGIINNLTAEDIAEFKSNSDKAAAVLTFENNKELFMNLVNKALN